MTRLSIDINDELHQFLKVHTAYKKETIVDFVRKAIEQRLDEEKTPNIHTLTAIKELESNGGVKYKSLELLMEDINEDN